MGRINETSAAHLRQCHPRLQHTYTFLTDHRFTRSVMTRYQSFRDESKEKKQWVNDWLTEWVCVCSGNGRTPNGFTKRSEIKYRCQIVQSFTHCSHGINCGSKNVQIKRTQWKINKSAERRWQQQQSKNNNDRFYGEFFYRKMENKYFMCVLLVFLFNSSFYGDDEQRYMYGRSGEKSGLKQPS